MLMRCLHGTDVLVDGDDHGNVTAEEIFTCHTRHSPIQKGLKTN